jgi:hypothetical protein
VAVSAATASALDAPETRRYLDETVRVWLGLPASASVDPPTLPKSLARLFLRLEEYETDRRDRWGRWDFDQSENFHAGRHRDPEVDRWVAARRAELADTTHLEPLWPDGRRFAVCLTHDVDLVSHRSTPRQAARHAWAGRHRGGLGRVAGPPVRLARALRTGIALVPSARETLERSAALEADRGATASYLFTVPPAAGPGRYDCVYAPDDPCLFRGERRRIADVMRALAVEGFDIGLHGSYEAGVRPGALAAERASLEHATGLEITSTRQHLLHWDVRRTPQLQEAARLRVDSSLGFNREVGFRAGTSLPFRQFDVGSAERLELLQIPLVAQDASLLDTWGLELDASRAAEIVAQLLDQAAELGTAATLVFHPDKLVRPDWRALYERALDYAAARGAWLTSLAQVAQWWRDREARILGG